MSMDSRIDNEALDQIFLNARTFNAFQDVLVPEQLLREIYEIAKLGPTGANCSPLRVLYVTTPEAKSRLIPTLMQGNQAKTAAAPAVAVLAYDLEFYEQLPFLFPRADIKSRFAENPDLGQTTALTNGALQAAYFLIAARSLGLSTGPMGGFDHDALDREFFSDRRWKSFMVVNLGYGDPTGLHPRLPRLSYETAVRME